VVWITVVTVLLGGIVALNVAVLRLNIRLDQLGRERAKLRADNAALGSQLSSAAASARIEDLARRQLGLVPAQATDTYYVDIAPR
jgi:cell division protein FtsL